MAFMDKVFYKPVLDDEWKTNIETIRERWAGIFCKSGYKIREGGAARTDITFFAALTIPLLTGDSSAITSSFPLLFNNGLKAEITSEMKEKFFEKMSTFLDICEQGTPTGYFQRLPKGYPKLGEISPILYLLNLHYSDEVDPHREQNDQLIENKLLDFFTTLNDTEGKMDTWTLRLRKNRNVKNLGEDLKFIRGEYAALAEENDSEEDA